MRYYEKIGERFYYMVITTSQPTTGQRPTRLVTCVCIATQASVAKSRSNVCQHDQLIIFYYSEFQTAYVLFNFYGITALIGQNGANAMCLYEWDGRPDRSYCRPVTGVKCCDDQSFGGSWYFFPMNRRGRPSLLSWLLSSKAGTAAVAAAACRCRTVPTAN